MSNTSKTIIGSAHCGRCGGSHPSALNCELAASTGSDLEKTEELFEFLQGRAPDGYKIPKAEMPQLTPEQAWTVIWYLGNQYWQVTDKIERCCVCGSLYDTWKSGTCIDGGEPPYHFCESCIYTEDYERKNSNQNE